MRRYVPLGRDERGAEHVWGATQRAVFVVSPDGGRERHPDRDDQEYLAGGDIAEWMAHVADTRGWDERWYGVSLGERLAESLEASD
jgi:hypothetical protein